MTRVRDTRESTSVSEYNPGTPWGDLGAGAKIIGVAGFDLPDTDPTDGQVAVWDVVSGAWIYADLINGIDVLEDGATIVAGASALDARHGLDVSNPGGGVARLAVDETELTGSLLAVPRGAEPIEIRYTFSTTTTDADPGGGNLRLSNATQYLAVTIRADLADVDGGDVTALLDTIDDRPASGPFLGQIRLQHAQDPSKWLVATVSALASPAGYRNITIANAAKSANSPFANGDPLVLTFVPGTHSQSHDHSASGDGTTLSPATLNIPHTSAPAQTTEGQVIWDDDDDKLTVGTGSGRKTMVNEGAVTTSGLTQASARILGRSTAGTGAIEEISVGTGLDLTAGVLSTSGGGAGGAPSTAKYVTTAADGTLSAEVVRPELGNFSRLASGYGSGTGTDEFDDASFTGWTLHGTGLVAGDFDESTYQGHVKATIPGSRGAFQVAEKAGYGSGDFILSSCLSLRMPVSDGSLWGILITDTSGNGAACLVNGTSGNDLVYYLAKIVSWDYNASVANVTFTAARPIPGYLGLPMYLELEKSGSTYKARLGFSPFRETMYEQTGTPTAFTAARIGFGRLFSAGSGTQYGVFDYLRSSV